MKRKREKKEKKKKEKKNREKRKEGKERKEKNRKNRKNRRTEKKKERRKRKKRLSSSAPTRPPSRRSSQALIPIKDSSLILIQRHRSIQHEHKCHQDRTQGNFQHLLPSDSSSKKDSKTIIFKKELLAGRAEDEQLIN